MKPRSIFDLLVSNTTATSVAPSGSEPFQDDETDRSHIEIEVDDDPRQLNDASGSLIDIADNEVEDDSDSGANFDDNDDDNIDSPEMKMMCLSKSK
ncbi:hypothetical protein PTKIN_Ptkin04bG0103000 [Pterospermum kingtungense]